MNITRRQFINATTASAVVLAVPSFPVLDRGQLVVGDFSNYVIRDRPVSHV